MRRWTRPWCRSWPRRRCSRWCRGWRHRGCRCGGRCRPARTHRAVEDFHRVQDCNTVGCITACQPDVVGAVSIGREVAPRFDERCANRPTIRHRIVDVHLVRRIGGLSTAPHDIHRVAEVKPSRFSRGPRYRRNVTDGIGHRIVNQ